MQQLFEVIDDNGDGVIQPHEMKGALSAGADGSPEARELQAELCKVLATGGLSQHKDGFGQLDLNSDGMVSR